MRLPVGFLIIGMGFAPFAPAVTNTLGVFRISSDSAAMIFATPLPLAFHSAADALLQMELRRFERLFAKTTAAARQAFLRIGSDPIL
jgi:hypothetical protein